MKTSKALILMILTLLPFTAWAQGSIRIDNAYVREMPPTAETAAVYMTIRNVGSHGIDITDVSTDVAESAMIHLSSMQNGMMVMEHLMTLEIPSGESVRLEPGSFHIMLEGLRRSLVAGDSIRMVLKFSNGMTAQVTVPVVRQPAP